MYFSLVECRFNLLIIYFKIENSMCLVDNEGSNCSSD